MPGWLRLGRLEGPRRIGAGQAQPSHSDRRAAGAARSADLSGALQEMRPTDKGVGKLPARFTSAIHMTKSPSGLLKEPRRGLFPGDVGAWKKWFPDCVGIWDARRRRSSKGSLVTIAFDIALAGEKTEYPDLFIKDFEYVRSD